MNDRQKMFFDAMIAEKNRAESKHGPEIWARHQFYGILLEEVDEAWADIKANVPQEQLMKELVQIASVCMRYFDTGDSRQGQLLTC